MPVYHFPTKEEREQLIRQMRDLAAKGQVAGPLYQEYAAAVEALDAKMSALSAPAEKGLPPALKQEDVEQLQGLITTAATAGERYLAGEGVSADQEPQAPLPQVVTSLQNMLSKDFKALNEYDPKRSKSLPELQADARGLTIDLRNRNLGTIGNMTNQRHFLTVVDSLGKKRSGVFTRKTTVQVKSKFMKVLESAKLHCDEAGKAELDKLIPGYRTYLIRNKYKKIYGERLTQKQPDDLIVGAFLKQIHNASLGPEDRGFGFVKKPVSYEALKTHMENAGVNMNSLSGAAKAQLLAGMSDLANTPASEMLTVSQGLSEGARLDNRNTAMSQVAGLMGLSGLLAKSENMKFIDKDGKTVEGTFMDYGDGVDLLGNPANFSVVSKKPFDKKPQRSSLYKQIADMQILDFLSLNLDRHPGNIVYKIDREGKIHGIQGIDNDTSFGNTKATMDSLEDLRVISSSTAEKIRNMTPDMLRFSLRGSGLPESELEYSVQRLNILKEGLKTGRLREVPDDKFGELTADDLEPQGEEGINLFAHVLTLVPTLARNAHQVYGRQRLSHLTTPEFANVSTTDRDHTVGGVRDSVRDVANMVENEETGFKMSDLVGIRGKSGKFKELMDQVKATAALQEGLFENRKNGSKWRADDAMSIEEAAALPTLARVDQAFEELDEKADAYLIMKMRERKASSLEELRGKNDYEQRHIDYAKNIRRIVREYRAKTAAPETEADKKAMMEKTDRAQLDDMRKATEAARRLQEAQAKKEQANKGQAEEGQDPLLIQ